MLGCGLEASRGDGMHSKLVFPRGDAGQGSNRGEFGGRGDVRGEKSTPSLGEVKSEPSLGEMGCDDALLSGRDEV